MVAIGLFFVADRHAPKPPSGSSQASALPRVDVSPLPLTGPADRYCAQFLAALPHTLDGHATRRVNAQDQYFLAWGDPAIVVRCGVPRPKAFVVGTETVTVSPPHGKPVRWFHESGAHGATWTAVDRPVYVSVFVPTSDDATGILQSVGTSLTAKLPARAIHPGKAH